MTDRHVGRDRQRLTASVTDLGVGRQRAIIVALADDHRTPAEVQASLDEIERLTDTAGSDVVERAVQRRPHPDPATYLGKGKAEELAAVGRALDVDLVVIDGELSPVQQRNLQQIFETDVVDRVALILDIFAQHATSGAGRAQVELAMLRYRLPRLRGKGVELSRLGGGIGTRGPGETKLESDRRRVLKRISQLEDDLESLSTVRHTQRKARRRSEIPAAALVGYTNAGKSSLLNRLTGANVLVEDRLFSTLDATVRRLPLPAGREVLISDTVGFVRDLPHTLVEAFRSTLEEVVDTDLLLHVVDAAADDADRQLTAVRATLQEIGAHELPELLVINKVDVAGLVVVERLLALHPGAVAVSATTGTGIESLLEAIESRLAPLWVDLDIVIPFDRGDLVSLLHRNGEVISEEHGPDGTRLKARVPARHAGAFEALQGSA
ncbi:MAG: GTPase HflX [Actinobacteria bacterium RBG_16_67_10]|nr:MAG: GTPase HflX [Actinobacteria bacterium RBG_16_67_10]